MAKKEFIKVGNRYLLKGSNAKYYTEEQVKELTKEKKAKKDGTETVEKTIPTKE